PVSAMRYTGVRWAARHHATGGARRHAKAAGSARTRPLSTGDQELLESFSRSAASDSSSARVPAEPDSLENEEPDDATSEMTSFAAAATCFLWASQRAWAAA